MPAGKKLYGPPPFALRTPGEAKTMVVFCHPCHPHHFETSAGQRPRLPVEPPLFLSQPKPSATTAWAKSPPSQLEDHPCHHLDPPAIKPLPHPHQMQRLGRGERRASTLFTNLTSIDKLRSSGIQGGSLRLREKGPALPQTLLELHTIET